MASLPSVTIGCQFVGHQVQIERLPSLGAEHRGRCGGRTAKLFVATSDRTSTNTTLS